MNKGHQNFYKATHYGVLFLIMYIPFMAVQNLLSEVQKSNGFGDLGFILLSIIYGS